MAFLAASWASCKSEGGAGGDDAGSDADAAADLDSTIPQDEAMCDPCQQVCACAFGDTLPTLCTTLTCPASGVWGGENFCTSGCEDASDDGPECDPCTTVCACALGYPPRLDEATCMLVNCKGVGTTGTWGPGVFCPTTNVCFTEGGVDAANESGADVIPDAMSEAAGD